MKNKLFGLIFGIGALFAGTQAAEAQTGDQYFWTGEADWRNSVVCLDTPTNARLTSDFGNNVRATLVGDTCGNPMYYNQGYGPIVYEDGFYLIEFYFDEVGETRRYWIYRNQIEDWYF